MNFTDTLNTPVNDIERPPLLPMGTYRWMVQKIPSTDTIADGRFDVVDFSLKAIEAQPDVDEDELAAYGELNNTYQRHRFMFNKEDEQNFNRSLFQLKQFMVNHLKVDVPENASLKEMMNDAVNCQCLGTVKWRADKNDPEIQYAEIGRTAPVE